MGIFCTDFFHYSIGYVRKGACLEQLRRFSEALHAYEKAYELDPNEPTVMESINRVRNYLGTGSSGWGSSGGSPGGGGINVESILGQAKMWIARGISQVKISQLL